ncbi:MAG TPA: hypothetical protein VNA28_02445 [Solirubrobacteraceae bacterium]|nr:hypothetical protein [Solirubrobacteraceae bacterium]
MSANPWIDPDPQPGDFDADLAKLGPRYVEHHDGNADAKLVVLVGVEGEDAKRLERIAEARGKTAADVVAELLRDAEQSLA